MPKQNIITDINSCDFPNSPLLRHEVKLQPDFQLAPAFRYRLLKMAAWIELGYLKQANYDAQLLIRDFGNISEENTQYLPRLFTLVQKQ